MTDGDDIAATQMLADRIRNLNNQMAARAKVDDERYNDLKKAIDTVARLESVINDFDIDNIPKRERKNLPYVLDWWGDRTERDKDWKYYLPLLLSFIGPIIGGIIVVLITHGGGL